VFISYKKFNKVGSYKKKIISVIREFATEKLDFDFNVKELKYREITNIKNKVYKIQNIQFENKANLKLNIKEIIFFKKNKGYFIEFYQIFHQFIRRFIFMHSSQIEKL